MNMFGRKKREKVIRQKGYESVQEIRPIKKKRNKKYFLLYIAGFAFLVYFSYTIISQSVELNSKREQLADINHQIEIKEIEIEYQNEVKNYSDDDLSEYIENIAREKLDYVKNGERVFVNISGD